MSTVLTLYDAVMSSTSAQAQRLHLHESSQVHVHMLGELSGLFSSGLAGQNSLKRCCGSA